jgi:epoxide hydrolase 4
MVKDEYANANGLRLHCVTAGKGQLILFLHGFPEFWYAWKNQLAEFGKDHCAVALDLPGFNLSDKPVEVAAYKIDKIVECLYAFTQQLSHGERFILVGHDWGGYLAWAFAVAHPEVLQNLVVINAPHPTIFAQLLNSDPAQQKASEYMAMFCSAQAEQILSANDFEFLANRVMAFGKKNGLPPEDKPEYIKAWSQPGAITGGLNYYRANSLTSCTIGAPELASSLTVDVPALVIWGLNDPLWYPRISTDWKDTFGS